MTSNEFFLRVAQFFMNYYVFISVSEADLKYADEIRNFGICLAL